MHIIIVSGSTLNNVLTKECYAAPLKPKDLYPGDLVLVCKRKKDLLPGEKQIQYVMTSRDVKKAPKKEMNNHFPGGSNRWSHLLVCDDARAVTPFDLDEVLGEDEAEPYRYVVNFKRVLPEHEEAILDYVG